MSAINHYLPLSENQQGLWHLQNIHPDLHAYNTSSIFRVRSHLDILRLQQALNQLVAQEPLLRTTFPLQDDTPCRIIQEALEPAFEHVMVPAIDEAELQRMVQANHDRPLDLTTGPLVRLTVFTRADDDHVLLLTFHHILLDFGSQTKLTKQLFDLYISDDATALSTDKSESETDYDDFVTWQQNYLDSPAATKARDYWGQQLSAPLPILDLLTDHPLPRQQTFNGGMVRFELPIKLSRNLMDLARQQRVTPFALLLTTFSILMARYSNQDDLIVGIPTDERLRAPQHFHQTLGHMVNLLPIRFDLSDEPTFADFLQQTQRTVMGGLFYQNYPFARMVQDAAKDAGWIHDSSRSPLFDVAFNMPVLEDGADFVTLMEGTPIEPVTYHGLGLEPFEICQQAAQTFLNLDMWQTDAGMVGFLKYNADLFDKATIKRMVGHFTVLLEGIVVGSPLGVAQPICQLPLLTEAEYHQIVHEWNDTAVDFGEPQTIHALFEQQVERTPDAIALVFEAGEQVASSKSASDASDDDRQPANLQTCLTYTELNARANQLAHYLTELGAGPDILMGICMDRSIEMVVGLLGILKAGSAYVPLDPTYPQNRLTFMLQQSKTNILLTQQRSVDKFPEYEGYRLCLDSDWDAIEQQSRVNPSGDTTELNLAYIIYTSGSTGVPKGVEIAHGAVLNTLHWLQETFSIDTHDVIAQKTAASFTDSVWEIFWPLIVGTKLVLIDDATVKDPQLLYTSLDEYKITVTQFVPPQMKAFLNVLKGMREADPLPCLKWVFNGGEALPVQTTREWYALFQRAKIANIYGMTESAIYATNHIVETRPLEEALSVPIGRPIANTQIFVLDAHQQLCPPRIAGEIYIGGRSLARGYLYRPDLTEDAFIPNPYAPKEHPSRLYRTGDLGFYRVDGVLEYLGRRDHQVQIRGFRVELGEIEAILREDSSVHGVAVVTHTYQADDKRILAYIVPTDAIETDENQSALIADLRQHVGQKLPSYMVPSLFIVLNELPLTPSGKVDRRALPPPTELTPLKTTSVLPQTTLEKLVAQIWCEELRIEQVGIHDNFFEVGGHSLLLIKIQTQLQEALGQALTVVDLMRYPTVHALCQFLTQSDNNATASGSSTRTHTERLEESEIAIIGMAGRFPNADSLDEFWQNLCEGQDSIARFSERQLLDSGVEAALLAHPNYIKAGGVLSRIEQFDAAFFGISPSEAELMDPQIRLFMESAWEALESAACNPETYAGRIGLYAGSGLNTYWHNNLAASYDPSSSANAFQAMLANDKDFLATRISYKLNLTGPSMTVQTACSTSLVAVHLACQGLLNGESDVALAGGVAVRTPHEVGYLYQDGMIFSPDGHCRAFDAQAEGTVFSNGLGLVVLKRLTDALADGDCIHAVIKGSAINNDGATKVGYTAPSVEGQIDVISEAMKKANVSPHSITYIEAHGTGTPLGDPIEMASLRAVFQGTHQAEGDKHCVVGSVKTNVGHLDAAAGIAGLIKTTLALKHKQLPPTVHFAEPNPLIQLNDSPFYINTALLPWQTDGFPRRAGVSSFGIGGTNAHVVLEEAPSHEAAGESRPWQLLLLSAKTPSALETIKENLALHLEAHPELNLADVAYTLAVGRQRHPYRHMVVCQPDENAAHALAKDKIENRVQYSESKTRPIAFMFPGQGAQYINMGRELYETEPVFQENVNGCSEILTPLLGFNLRDLLYPQPKNAEVATDQLAQTAITQPAIFVTSYALARLWRSWGVQPQAMIGHSIGEYVAATLAGIFTLEDALALVAARGQLMQEQPGGAMLAVPLPKEELHLTNELSLAAVNSPTRSVVSGTTEAVDAYQQRLIAQGILCRRLHTSHAFHSVMMEPVLDEFVEQVKWANPQPPQMPLVSNVTGRWLTTEEAVDPHYWASHLRQTVDFSRGLELLLEEPDLVLLEVGPGETLGTFARQFELDEQIILQSLPDHRKEEADSATLLTNLGQLWLSGGTIDWDGFYIHEKRHRLALPTYPFERQRYWIDPPGGDASQSERTRPLAFHSPQKQSLADWFYLPSWERAVLPSHQNQSQAATLEDRAATKNCWLLFLDDDEDDRRVGTQLAQRLIAQDDDVVTVEIGSNFRKLDKQRYALDPGNQQNYDFLFQELAEQGKHPQKIVHLWSMATRTTQLDRVSVAADLSLSFDSLLLIAQALGSLTEPLQFTVITNNMQDVIGNEPLRPEQATVLGPIKVIPQEFPHVNCCSIDLCIDDPGDVPSILIDQILTEISHSFAQINVGTKKQPAPIIALRGKHRWTQTFQPVQLPVQSDGNGQLSLNPPASIRENGVYLITGGLGGMGLTLAEYLAKFNSRLILVGRTALPDRAEWSGWLAAHDETDAISDRIRKIQAIEETGAEVLVLRADVSSEVDMQNAVAQGMAHFGQINGVIHAAGLPGDGMALRKTTEDAHAVLAPKVKGTLVLDAVLKEMELDFILLCSSLASIMGGVGQVDYAAANAFLDAFAQKQHGMRHVTSVNWDTWQIVGMAANAPGSQDIQTHWVEHLQQGILPEEGQQVMRRVLESRHPQVVVSTVDLKARAAHAAESFAASPVATSGQDRNLYARPDLNNDYVVPTTATEQQLATLWSELLGLLQVGIHDDFFALGGDSLMATQLMARIRDDLQIDLPLRTFFDHRTIANLATKLDSYQIVHAMQSDLLSEDKVSVAIPAEQEEREQEGHGQEEREKEIW